MGGDYSTEPRRTALLEGKVPGGNENGGERGAKFPRTDPGPKKENRRMRAVKHMGETSREKRMLRKNSNENTRGRAQAGILSLGAGLKRRHDQKKKDAKETHLRGHLAGNG